MLSPKPLDVANMLNGVEILPPASSVVVIRRCYDFIYVIALPIAVLVTLSRYGQKYRRGDVEIFDPKVPKESIIIAGEDGGNMPLEKHHTSSPPRLISYATIIPVLLQSTSLRTRTL